MARGYGGCLWLAEAVDAAKAAAAAAAAAARTPTSEMACIQSHLLPYVVLLVSWVGSLPSKVLCKRIRVGIVEMWAMGYGLWAIGYRYR